MNILLVYAHPEPKSLNGSLKDFTVSHLTLAGHTVEVSDLYAMNWKAALDKHDGADDDKQVRFDPSSASLYAFSNGLQSADIAAEQQKLDRADMLILQFPLWWFSMPAIMKGWIDRVYACGFAYGVGEHSDSHWGDRYGEGRMAGKRAMIIVTTGGWVSHYAPRGVNGPIDDLLFPIQHGILWYPGFDVLPPFVVYRTGRVDEPKYRQLCDELGKRLDVIEQTQPIQWHRQNSGAYTIPELTLREDIAPGEEGFPIHLIP